MSKLDRNALTENEIVARWEMFGPLPVLSSENKEGYYKLRNAFVRYFRPTDIRHWSWIRELVDTQWEIHGHLRSRALAVKRYDPFWREHQYKEIFQQVQQAKKQVRELPQVSEYELLQADLSCVVSRIAMAERELQELAQPNDSKDRLAYENAAKHIEKADKWLKNATARRNSLLKILEYYCPIDRNVEIRATNYNALKQNEVKQITVSPLVPAASVGSDLTTKDQPETVASTTE